MVRREVTFRTHALQRLFERRITVAEVRQVLEHGEVIEDYPTDFPFPSCLLLAHVGGRPLHVVAADNEPGDETIVITVYEPDPAKWEPDWKTRRPA
jgi:hypothetical protein